VLWAAVLNGEALKTDVVVGTCEHTSNSRAAQRALG